MDIDVAKLINLPKHWRSTRKALKRWWCLIIFFFIRALAEKRELWSLWREKKATTRRKEKNKFSTLLLERIFFLKWWNRLFDTTFKGRVREEVSISFSWRKWRRMNEENFLLEIGFFVVLLLFSTLAERGINQLGGRRRFAMMQSEWRTVN